MQDDDDDDDDDDDEEEEEDEWEEVDKSGDGDDDDCDEDVLTMTANKLTFAASWTKADGTARTSDHSQWEREIEHHRCCGADSQ